MRFGKEKVKRVNKIHIKLSAATSVKSGVTIRTRSKPFRFMGIRANGDVFPCCNWDVDQPIARVSLTGKSPGSDLREAWNHSNWQVLREEVISGKYPVQCRKCMGNFTQPLHDEYLS